MEFQAIVMAAGRGSRMMGLTASIPKALLPVANNPMVSYPIKMLQKAGFGEAIVVVQEQDLTKIQKSLAEVCEMRLDFVTIPQGEDWGTADTLRHIKDKIRTNDFLVVSCDLISDIKLHHVADLHRTYDSTVTMLLAPAPDTTDMASPGGKAGRKIERDIVGLKEDGSRVLFLSSEADFEECISFRKSFFKKHPNVTMKTKLLDGHLYIMKSWVLDILQEDESISTIKGELVPMLVRKQFSPSVADQNDRNKTHADLGDNTHDIYSMGGDDMMKIAQTMSTWVDHRGDMEDCYHDSDVRCYAHIVESGLVLRANSVVTYCEANRQVPKQLEGETPNIHPTASIQPRSQVGSDSLVGEGTSIGEKVGIKRSFIGKHCTISEKVKVTNSIIFDHVTIQEGCTLTGCVVCSNAHLAEKCELKDCLVGANQNILPMGKFSNEIIMELDRMEI